MKLVKVTHDVEFTVKIKYSEIGELEDLIEVPSKEELFQNIVDKIEIAFGEIFAEELQPEVIVKKYDLDIEEMLDLKGGRISET